MTPSQGGSAFGVGVYFRKEDFELLRGELKSYHHRSDESSRWLRMEFCPNCGTTVTWTLELFPDGRGVAGGSFDDPSWAYDMETFEKSAIAQPTKTGR